MKNLKSLSVIILCLSVVLFSACEEEELTASVSVNEVGGTFGGDVTGDGGSVIKSYSWNNTLQTADVNMDITASKGGSFTLTITDPGGVEVMNETLIYGQGEDSRSGVTTSGEPGDWTVTITLVNFNGDGSFSLTPGD